MFSLAPRLFPHRLKRGVAMEAFDHNPINTERIKRKTNNGLIYTYLSVLLLCRAYCLTNIILMSLEILMHIGMETVTVKKLLTNGLRFLIILQAITLV
jgi:hypothetical protein